MSSIDEQNLISRSMVWPLYAKASLLCIGMVAFIWILFIIQGILLPLIYAIIISIVLSPFVDFLVRKKFNRVLAIFISIASVVLISVVLVGLLSSQISLFNETFPVLLSKSGAVLSDLQLWLTDTFHISPKKLNSWINETKVDLTNSASGAIGQTLIGIGGVLVLVLLIPVYIFLILYYQPLLVQFIHQLFKADKQADISSVLSASKGVIQSYLVGLLLEMLIVAAMNTTSLLILGIDYAILLGVIGAVLNLIPYIGGIIAVALPIIIAFATQSPFSAFLVLVSYAIIQFIDNNLIVTKVVASKVEINALVSIVVVIAGGALWGLAGMFLAIPLTAILKVIFDHVDDLKPWGFLLGRTVEKKPIPPIIQKIAAGFKR